MGYKQDSTAPYFAEDAVLHVGHSQLYMKSRGKYSGSAAPSKKTKE